jgi:hypothetical protein
VLDLAQPLGPARSLIRQGRLARLDEARRAAPLAGNRGRVNMGQALPRK